MADEVRMEGQVKLLDSRVEPFNFEVTSSRNYSHYFLIEHVDSFVRKPTVVITNTIEVGHRHYVTLGRLIDLPPSTTTEWKRKSFT